MRVLIIILKNSLSVTNGLSEHNVQHLLLEETYCVGVVARLCGFHIDRI